MKVREVTGDPFIAYLRNQFALLKAKNPRYSLRAFAGKLGVDPSALSKAFAGKKDFSVETRAQCLERLGASAREKKAYLKTGEFEELSYEFIPEDVFEVLGNWKNFAVLEFLRISNDKTLLRKLRTKLDIDAVEAQEILGRLERLGFIRKTESGYETLKPNNSWSVINGDTSAARRRLQKEILERSLVALECVPIDLREHGSLLVAIDPKRLPEFKERLRRIRLELSDYFQSTPEATELYQFQLSFFPLTR